MLKDLVTATRSFRRFREDAAIDEATLRELLELARLSASGKNLQPLKYLLSCDAEKNAAVFRHLAWAGDLPDWPGPAEGERPAAYIVVLLDTEIADGPGCDHGITLQSIRLGATERGLGSCALMSVERGGLRRALAIPERFEILLVIALGEPGETVVLEEMAGGDTRYWRDDAGRHHVPKRGLDELIL